MKSIYQFNQLQGKIVSRKELERLYELAQEEEQIVLASRIDAILKAYPKVQEFEVNFDEEAIEEAPLSALGAVEQVPYDEFFDDDEDPHTAFMGAAGSQKAVYEQITKQVIEMVKKAKKSDYKTAWNSPFTPLSYGTKKPYRGMNRAILSMLMITHGYSNPYFLTKKQIEKTAKGKLKPKAVACKILKYMILYSHTDKEKNIKINGFSEEDIRQKIKSHYDAEDISSHRVDRIPLAKIYTVYNGDDVTGINFKLPERGRKDVSDNQIADLIVKYYPNPPKIVHYKEDEAFFDSNEDKICIPEKKYFHSDNDYYRTLFHELTHSTGASHRLNRKFGEWKTAEYAKEELVAEFGAIFLSAEAGIMWTLNKNHAAYLKDWNSVISEAEENPYFLFRGASQAQKAVDYILDVADDGVPAYYQELPKAGKQKTAKKEKVKTHQQMLNEAHKKNKEEPFVFKVGDRVVCKIFGKDEYDNVIKEVTKRGRVRDKFGFYHNKPFYLVDRTFGIKDPTAYFAEDLKLATEKPQKTAKAEKEEVTKKPQKTQKVAKTEKEQVKNYSLDDLDKEKRELLTHYDKIAVEQADGTHFTLKDVYVSYGAFPVAYKKGIATTNAYDFKNKSKLAFTIDGKDCYIGIRQDLEYFLKKNEAPKESVKDRMNAITKAFYERNQSEWTLSKAGRRETYEVKKRLPKWGEIYGFAFANVFYFEATIAGKNTYGEYYCEFDKIKLGNLSVEKAVKKIEASFKKQYEKRLTWLYSVAVKRGVAPKIDTYKEVDYEKIEPINTKTQKKSVNEEGIQGLGATALDKDTIAFNKAILKAKREGINPAEEYNLGKPKNVLAKFFNPNRNIVMLGSVIEKAMTKNDEHILDWGHFINLPDAINNPIAIFKSRSKAKAKVVLTEVINAKQKPTIVILSFSKTYKITEIKSLYARRNDRTYQKWEREGLLLYKNKKSDLLGRVFLGTIPSSPNKPLSEDKATKKSKTTKKDTEFFSGGMGSVAPVVAAPMAVAPVASPQVMPTPQVPAIRPQAQPKTVTPKVPQTTAMTQIGQSDFDFFEVAGQEGEFLQLVEKKPVGSVVITIDGPQGAGKTTMLYRFMNSFAVTGNACLFLSLEEHPESFLSVEKRNKYLTPTAQSHISTVGELESLQQLYELIEPFDIIFIDSWQKLVRAVGNIRLDEDLRKKFNSKCFVIIFQQTVTGRTKGGAEIVFDGDIIIKMMKAKNFDENYAFFDKNRYTRTAIHLLRYNIASGVVYNPELQQEVEDIEYEEVY